jgi:hypothetical protein
MKVTAFELAIVGAGCIAFSTIATTAISAEPGIVEAPMSQAERHR